MAEVKIERSDVVVNLMLTQEEAVALERFLFSGAWPTSDDIPVNGRARTLNGIQAVLRPSLQAEGVPLLRRGDP